MGKSGRPSKYESNVKPRFQEIHDWIQIGATDKEIAENLGINKATFCEYKKQYSELNELLKKSRRMPVKQIKAALFKRATGFQYSEKKTVIEFEEWSDEVKDVLAQAGIDSDSVEQRKLVRVEVYEKQALPDPTSAMMLLRHWDDETEWTSDPAQLKLKKEELELKKKHIESEIW